MASVTHLVRFRMLLDQLSDTEFLRFITEATKESGRAIICTALFSHFSDQKHANSSHQALDGMMSMTEDIIRNRKRTDNADQDPPHSMQSLSTVLIGEIGSYLVHSDYISLTRCQRATYIGCTSPCTLRALDLIEVTNYRLVDLSKYQQIRYLGLDLRKFRDLVFPNNQNICTHLKRLNLHNGYEDDADIQGLLNQTALPLSSITHLKLSGFGSADGFPTNAMMDLLSMFPNTECLSMRVVTLDLDDLSFSRLVDYLPKLTTFIAWCCITESLIRIISMFGKQLKAVKVFPEDMDIPQNVAFKAMEELSVPHQHGSGSVMDSIRKSTKSLQRIYFCWGESDKSLVTDLLTEQKQLQQLVISTTYKDFEEVCRALDRAVFNIRKMKRESIQIKVKLGGSRRNCNASDIIFNLTKVVNALKSSKIEQFSCRFNLFKQSVESIDNLKRELTCFKEQNSSQCDVRFNDNNIVVTNKGYVKNVCVYGDLRRGWLTDF